ncbi:unnamed protein product [Moneuplotes crassus]|uniref:Short-chain dehydrogenase/reductase 3 n=1 Tax=Euplotes crassus TaxID=5936 RepID=A0AAD1XEX1_EUPCR|nr:unnamed protein product [Moneuplotes crassus]
MSVASRALERLKRIKSQISPFSMTKTKLAIGAGTAYAAYQYLKNNGYGFKKDVKNEHVYITGAGSGLGKIVSKKLAKLGANITVTDIDLTAAEQTVQEIELEGGNAIAIKVDVSNPENIKESAEIATKRFGNVTILINNAGIVSGKKILDISNELVKKTFEVNSLALIYTTKQFLPQMLEMDKGHIVTIASAAGYIGSPGLVDYSASKFAAIGIDESLRTELANIGSKVTTTCVCPYFINTGMFDGVQTRFPSILPILKPEWASQRIVDAILKEESMAIFPWFIGNAHLFKALLPPKMFDMVSEFFGINDIMKNFKGRH